MKNNYQRFVFLAIFSSMFFAAKIQDGIYALVNYIDDYSEKSYGDEISVRDGEIGEYGSLDSVKFLTRNLTYEFLS